MPHNTCKSFQDAYGTCFSVTVLPAAHASLSQLSAFSSRPRCLDRQPPGRPRAAQASWLARL